MSDTLEIGDVLYRRMQSSLTHKAVITRVTKTQAHSTHFGFNRRAGGWIKELNADKWSTVYWERETEALKVEWEETKLRGSMWAQIHPLLSDAREWSGKKMQAVLEAIKNADKI